MLRQYAARDFARCTQLLLSAYLDRFAGSWGSINQTQNPSAEQNSQSQFRGWLFAPSSNSMATTVQAPSIPVNEGTKGDAALRQIVFVLGGPGSGKGTQCANLINEFDLVHLSAGDLLRAHMASGSPEGQMIADMIKEGKIVPSEVTIGLLEKAMTDSGRTQFLIDGFPRNSENQQNFVKITGMDCKFVLFFDCPEEVMEQRLLGRNQGRTDDNIETIKKRFKTFMDSTMPVVAHYKELGRVRIVNADRSPDEIYNEVRTYFAGFATREP